MPGNQLNATSTLMTGWMDVTEIQSGDFMMLFIDVWTEALRQTNQEIKKIFDMKNFFREYRALVAAILQEGIDKGEFREIDTLSTAGTLLATFDGIMLQWLLERDNMDMKKTIDSVLDLVWNGIAKR